MKDKKIEPWRLVVGGLAIGYIVYMWVEKDIAGIYSTMPQEQVMPLIVTTVAVTLLKVLGITVGILLLKWIVKKITKILRSDK